MGVWFGLFGTFKNILIFQTKSKTVYAHFERYASVIHNPCQRVKRLMHGLETSLLSSLHLLDLLSSSLWLFHQNVFVFEDVRFINLIHLLKSSKSWLCTKANNLLLFDDDNKLIVLGWLPLSFAIGQSIETWDKALVANIYNPIQKENI